MTFVRSPLLLALLGLLLAGAGLAAERKPAATNSALDRDLFYELLVGEMSAQSGDLATAFSLMMDAARKSGQERVYQRAVELALNGRSGNFALEAARAWAAAFPASTEAHRYLLQILSGLNRPQDIAEPLRRHLASVPPNGKAAVIAALPRHFARAADKRRVAQVLEQALAAELQQPVLGAVAWSSIGWLRLQAGDNAAALEAARRGSTLNAKAAEPPQLALGLLGAKVREAEPLVQRYLAQGLAPELRMGYVRYLLDAERVADAGKQVRLLTRESPGFAQAWLVQGSLEFQDQQAAQAEVSLQTYVRLLTEEAKGARPDPHASRGLVQAYLLLGFLADQQGRSADAQALRQRIDDPKEALQVAERQAALMVRQGRIAPALDLVRSVPEADAEAARLKLGAEVQVLRDHKQYQAAYERLVVALERYPNDTDLVYDRAMMAERLGRLDEMEDLLRSLIRSKPDYHHAYNALGYSWADRNVRLDEARALIVKALELAPNDPYITDSLGWVEFRQGNTQESLRLLQQAFQARPDAEIAAHLGEVLWVAGQREAARATWKQGLELNPDNETLLETLRRLQAKP